MARYTLTRTQLNDLPGLNEGLAILEALIHVHWLLSFRQNYFHLTEQVTT